MTESQELIGNLQLKIKNKTEDLKKLEHQISSLRSDIGMDISNMEKIIIDTKDSLSHG